MLLQKETTRGAADNGKERTRKKKKRGKKHEKLDGGCGRFARFERVEKRLVLLLSISL